MAQEQYMGNVGTNMPNMQAMPNMDYMQGQMPMQGCGMGMMQGGCGIGAMQGGCMSQQAMQPACSQVVQQTCAVDMPYYVNYNTHVVNNVVRRHIQIPVYSQTQETIYFDEWQAGCGCGCNR
jgi:hypothetical protein